jgi:hypothetical protein
MTLAHPTVEECEAAAADLRLLGGVEAVDVIERDPRFARDRPAVEVTVTGTYERVPPQVLRTLAEHDLGLWAADPRAGGDAFTVVAC